MAIPTTKEMIALFNQVNADCMRDGADSIPFSDVEYYTEQIETIYDVPQLTAEHLAINLKEYTEMERQFEMTGFKHVTLAGAQAFMCMMESEGSIAMLWDISNQRRADILMQENDFDMTGYCKRNSSTEEELDHVMIELHEELVDARFCLEYAFIQNLTDVDCPVGERTFHNLDCIQHNGEWISTICYPLVEKAVFSSYDDFAGYCIDHLGHDIEELTVRIDAVVKQDSSDGQVTQSFEYIVTGAGDCNCLGDILEALTGWDYVVTFTVIR